MKKVEGKMAHYDMMEDEDGMEGDHSMDKKPKNDEMNIEVDTITIRRLPNGKFKYEVMSREGRVSDSYMFESVEKVMDAISDDLGSPHMKESSKESGSIQKEYSFPKKKKMGMEDVF